MAAVEATAVSSVRAVLLARTIILIIWIVFIVSVDDVIR